MDLGTERQIAAFGAAPAGLIGPPDAGTGWRRPSPEVRFAPGGAPSDARIDAAAPRRALLWSARGADLGPRAGVRVEHRPRGAVAQTEVGHHRRVRLAIEAIGRTVRLADGAVADQTDRGAGCLFDRPRAPPARFDPGCAP